MADNSRPQKLRAARGSASRSGQRTARADPIGDEPHVGKPLRVEDPRAIRALAHPARMAIIDALASGEALTATDCAALTGLTPSATAYHLKFLERYGFAEPAPARPDGRERPWRASGRQVGVDLDSSTPAGAAAAAAVVTAHFDTTRALGLAFIEGSYTETGGWRDEPTLSNNDLWLTVAEMESVGTQLAAVLDPYRGRTEVSLRPKDTRRVRVMNVVVPHPQPRA